MIDCRAECQIKVLGLPQLDGEYVILTAGKDKSNVGEAGVLETSVSSKLHIDAGWVGALLGSFLYAVLLCI
jgi:hypothetical protein